jgi:hypothetical protein
MKLIVTHVEMTTDFFLQEIYFLFRKWFFTNLNFVQTPVDDAF